MTERMHLPGDTQPEAEVARMIRVDHAGEYGAARIYAGQLAVLGRRPSGDVLRHMQAQEERHLRTFEDLIGTASGASDGAPAAVAPGGLRPGRGDRRSG